MSTARNIPVASLASSFGLSVSTSPATKFYSPASPETRLDPRSLKRLKPFDTQDIKILLLENVNKSGIEVLESQGYQVEALKSSLSEEDLIEKIR